MEQTIKSIKLLNELGMNIIDARSALNFIGVIPAISLDPSQELDISTCVLLTLCSLLNSLGLQQREQYDVLRITKDDITEQVNRYMQLEGGMFGLLLMDNRYATLSNWSRLYDYKKMEWSQESAFSVNPISTHALMLPGIIGRVLRPIMTSDASLKTSENASY